MNNYAGFLQRITAFFLDYVIILIYLAAITLLMRLLDFLFRIDLLFADRVRAQFVGFLLVTLPVALNFAISEASNQQATWGKQRVVLKVTDYNGERISFGRSLAGTLLKFIPWELSHTLIWELSFSPQADDVLVYYGFGFVYVLVELNIANFLLTKKHQTIYDLLAKTYVVKHTL